MSSIFCRNANVAARSAAKLRDYKLNLLCTGHGPSLVAPQMEMDRAVNLALRQHPGAKKSN